MLLQAKENDGDYRYGRCHDIELIDTRDCAARLNGEQMYGYCLSEGEGNEMCAYIGKKDEPHRCKYFDGVIPGSKKQNPDLHVGWEVTVSCLCHADK